MNGIREKALKSFFLHKKEVEKIRKGFYDFHFTFFYRPHFSATHSHTLSLIHKHTCTHSHSLIDKFELTYTHSNKIHTTHTNTNTLTITHTHTPSLSLSLSLSNTQKHIHNIQINTHKYKHTHAHAHEHTHSFFLSLRNAHTYTRTQNSVNLAIYISQRVTCNFFYLNCYYCRTVEGFGKNPSKGHITISLKFYILKIKQFLDFITYIISNSTLFRPLSFHIKTVFKKTSSCDSLWNP